MTQRSPFVPHDELFMVRTADGPQMRKTPKDPRCTCGHEKITHGSESYLKPTHDRKCMGRGCDCSAYRSSKTAAPMKRVVPTCGVHRVVDTYTGSNWSGAEEADTHPCHLERGHSGNHIGRTPKGGITSWPRNRMLESSINPQFMRSSDLAIMLAAREIPNFDPKDDRDYASPCSRCQGEGCAECEGTGKQYGEPKQGNARRTYRCDSCNHTFNQMDQHAYCPNCSSFLVNKNASRKQATTHLTYSGQYAGQTYCGAPKNETDQYVHASVPSGYEFFRNATDRCDQCFQIDKTASVHFSKSDDEVSDDEHSVDTYGTKRHCFRCGDDTPHDRNDPDTCYLCGHSYDYDNDPEGKAYNKYKTKIADSMFPGAGAVVDYNEAGEPLGWDYPSQGDEGSDPYDDYDSDSGASDAFLEEIYEDGEGDGQDGQDPDLIGHYTHGDEFIGKYNRTFRQQMVVTYIDGFNNGAGLGHQVSKEEEANLYASLGLPQ